MPAIHLVTTDYHAWLQPAALPQLPVKKFPSSAGLSTDIYAPKWLESVLRQWIQPDPLPTLPRFQSRFTPGSTPSPPQPQPPRGNAVNVPHGVLQSGAVPVYVLAPTSSGGIAPFAGVANTVTNAGVAIVAVVGPVNGGYITNPANAAAQGIMTAENINVDMTSPPLAGDAYGYGTTVLLTPGQNFNIPGPLATGQQIWVNASTAGHRITVVVW